MGKCMHVIPGRARFAIPALHRSETVARALLRGLRAMDGVESVDVRRGSGCLVVHYDPARLDFATLEAFVTGRETLPHAPAPVLPAAAAPRRQDVEGTAARPGLRAAAAPLLVGTARHLGTVVSQTTLKVMLEKVVQAGVSSLLGSAVPVRR